MKARLREEMSDAKGRLDKCAVLLTHKSSCIIIF